MNDLEQMLDRRAGRPERKTGRNDFFRFVRMVRAGHVARRRFQTVRLVARMRRGFSALQIQLQNAIEVPATFTKRDRAFAR